jgi:hypothetical protein
VQEWLDDPETRKLLRGMSARFGARALYDAFRPWEDHNFPRKVPTDKVAFGRQLRHLAEQYGLRVAAEKPVVIYEFTGN